MTDPVRHPRLGVLLAVYNGADYLKEQLDSYLCQSLPPALLLVSDDGSTDATREIISAFARAHPELPVQLLDGPRQGSARNFLSLLARTPEWIDVVALSDQDDVWLPDKLFRGVRQLEEASGIELPRLYCGRSWECNEELRNQRLSRGLLRPGCFRHAMVQNIAGGNTMILNRTALDLARRASLEARRVVVHDWWLYQIITGAGGEVLFDDQPMLLYRQHGNNLIGANRGLKAKVKRVMVMTSGGLRRWNTVNIGALRASSHRLTEENRKILREFSRERHAGPFRRLRMLRRTGVYRQGLAGTLSLYAAAVLGQL